MAAHTFSRPNLSRFLQGLDYINGLGPKPGKKFDTLYPAADPSAIDLLWQMLHFNPKSRVTAEEALEHDFFKTVRRKEFELDGTALEGPDFLEAASVDLDTIRRKTYEEVMWYSKQNNAQRKIHAVTNSEESVVADGTH
jgi:serine/threonine protein kinase